MEDWELNFIRIKEYFRRNEKTNWGKNQLIERLDLMHDRIKAEKMAKENGIE